MQPGEKATKRSDMAHRVVELLRATGEPMKRVAIARELGIEPKDQSLRRAIRELVEQGLASVSKDDRSTVVSLNVSENRQSRKSDTSSSKSKGVNMSAPGSDTLTPSGLGRKTGCATPER